MQDTHTRVRPFPAATASAPVAWPLFSCKRIFDFALGLILLPLLSPLMLAVALIVKLDGGPVIYGHTRIGMNGRPFKCWKFRSMVPDADRVLLELLASDELARAEWHASRKLAADPRVTAIGQLLRKTSLDELPQIFNVVAGDMSFVGPRPVVQQELDDFYGPDGNASYSSLRPGITGLWQIGGRSDTDYETRVLLDTRYVQSRSFLGDLQILVKTVGVVLTRRGAR